MSVHLNHGEGSLGVIHDINVPPFIYVILVRVALVGLEAELRR